MPADDGLHEMPPEDLAAFLHDLRALREREGLSLDGLTARAELPPGAGPAAAGQPGFSITRLGRAQPGPRRGRWRPSPGLTGVMAAAVALAALAAGGALLSRPAGHGATSVPAAPLPGGGRSMTDQGGRLRMRTVLPGRAGQRPAPASPGRARVPREARVRARVPVLIRPVRPAGTGTEVAGVGCPDSQGDGISLAAATTGPGWTAAGGGWTGDGCDGSSVWTMDPNGNQTSPSTLTWFFHPTAQASACRLDVFVPTRNALGVASYEITDGAVSLGSVSVGQAASAGQWVALGSYPVAGGMLDIRLLPGTATLTAATSGTGGKGHFGNGGNGGSASGGKGGNGPGGSASGHATPTPSPASGDATPTPSPAPGHNAAVAASAASASCR
jgi:hypothetical protein